MRGAPRGCPGFSLGGFRREPVGRPTLSTFRVPCHGGQGRAAALTQPGPPGAWAGKDEGNGWS